MTATPKCPDKACAHPCDGHTARGGCLARKSNGRTTCPCNRMFPGH